MFSKFAGARNTAAAGFTELSLRRPAMTWPESHAEVPVQHLGPVAHGVAGQRFHDVAVVDDVDAIRGVCRSRLGPAARAIPADHSRAHSAAGRIARTWGA